MKISKAIFLVFFLTAATSFDVFADADPGGELPPPTTARPPGDPDLPIDQNLEILLLGGLLLGAVFIYKDKVKKKLQF